ncbi:MAG TPA: methyltransferase domain-containing protein [Polyangiaceae bacterium]|nr:methyltransferase domain-containing protein [Polyangiaceae bacterium]
MEPSADWNPEQYARFRDERSRPFFELLALVRPRDAMRIVDLGCGSGELTERMHVQLVARETLGIDTSDAMLGMAAARAGGSLRFEKHDIATFTAAEPFELVFSNAAIHWVDDHPRLLARLTSLLAPGGQLAVQIPANDDHPAHTVARELAREEPFRGALGGYERVLPNLRLDAYASLLHRLGFREQVVRMNVYPHLLAAREDVVEWVKGSLLTDYEKRMSRELWSQFLAGYRERLLPQLEGTKPYFYPFKRILFWGAL